MKIIVTAGGTSEKIDSVRVITNSATGRLGSMIARDFYLQAADRIEKIYYLCGNGVETPDIPCLFPVSVSNTVSLQEALTSILTSEKIDAVIHSMAVSDFTVKNLTTAEKLAETIALKITEEFSSSLPPKEALKTKIECYITENENVLDNTGKLPSDWEDMLLSMCRLPKVIGCVKVYQPGTILVGFKLLDNVSEEMLVGAALDLMSRNGCDFVLANDRQYMKNGEQLGLLVSPGRKFIRLNGKKEIAEKIVSAVLNRLTNCESKAGERA